MGTKGGVVVAKRTVPSISAFELEDEKPVSMRRLWLRDHKTALIIIGVILVIVAVFFGIRWYNDFSNPITKFMSASAKNFNSSFSFDVSVKTDDKPVMQYSGDYQADPNKQNLLSTYDADYGSYRYSGVVYSVGEDRVRASLYKDTWHFRDVTDKVLNFFDFNTDYRAGSFDGASFLRFTDLTSRFTAGEVNDFMKLLKSRLSGSSELAKLDIHSSDNGKTYTYDINTGAFFELVRDKGASIFFSALDYDAFVALYEMNRSTAAYSDLIFSFTVDGSGSLSALSLSLSDDDASYAIECTMTDVGKTEVEIPAEFLTAAGIEQ